jgi:toxin ParE1/3/4
LSYRIIIEPIAIQDIQIAIDYYDEKVFGLGEKFEAALNQHLVTLKNNPFFQCV